MSVVDGFWNLGALSDQQVLAGLRAVLNSGRQLLAELVAHLAEVEERRLHLQAASSSMFHYCVVRLGLSEDEACRRIEVARLARRCPAIFPLLASGELSLSVAALLKPHLSVENHVCLLAAVRGKSVQRAREALAALFPKPDVPSSVRKLPNSAASPQPILLANTAAPSPAPFDTECQAEAMILANPRPAPVIHSSLPSPSIATTLAERVTPKPEASRNAKVPSRPSPGSTARIDPLSSDRYKVQFTASIELKAKLDLARELMRHAHPNSDFAPIIERALDLLIEDLMKRRFGSAARRRSRNSKAGAPAHGASESDTSAHVASPAGTCGSRHISRATRRVVFERDGLGCSWLDEHGVRCNAKAWLEHDHRFPYAKGGGSAPDNLRLLCRAHNRLVAEQAYGRKHMDQAVARRQREAGAHQTPDLR